MNLYGYPGLLRELSSPPPWTQVKQEDIDDDISKDRAYELRPFVVHAQEQSEECLVARYRAKQQHVAALLNLPTYSDVAEAIMDSFRVLIGLAKVLGVELFDAIYDAVFKFDEFTLAPGTPDLLVWLPRQERSCWFFSEVKAPGDSLRNSQKEWLHKHWDLVCGHYLITILE
jgi:hypothetical protein